MGENDLGLQPIQVIQFVGKNDVGLQAIQVIQFINDSPTVHIEYSTSFLFFKQSGLVTVENLKFPTNNKQYYCAIRCLAIELPYSNMTLYSFNDLIYLRFFIIFNLHILWCLQERMSNLGVCLIFHGF